MLTLADVFEAFTHTRPAGTENIAILSGVADSRQVQPGSLFVALKGETLDGHAFIPDALARGAVAIIAEARTEGVPHSRAAQANSALPSSPRVILREGLGPHVHWIDLQNPSVAGLQPSPSPLAPVGFIASSSLLALQQLARFWRRKFKCQVIGVTGSVGKSSTKELIASVMRQRFNTFKSEGNLNSDIGLPLMLLQMNEAHERAVLEMAMYSLGEIKTLCEIAQPRIGVVTNVGPAHLSRLGTLENIARAKAELPDALPSDGFAILNGDDERVIAMKDKTRAKVFSYGLNPGCDVWANEIESYGLEGIGFALHYHDEKLYVRVPLIGRHSVHTALAATAVGLVEELSWDEILNGLRDVAAQLRLLAVPAENGATILDDTYNSSPASVFAALNLLAELNGRKIAVLGDMLELGIEELRGHQLVGGRAAEVVDVLVAVGSRARWIGEAARAVGLSAENVFFANDNAQAIEILRTVMREGDMVLIKGSRGVKMEEIVGALARANGMTVKH